MPMAYSKSSSKLLNEKLSKSNMRSPKTVKTYIKEIDEKEKLMKVKDKSDSKTEENPTHLNNVLNALKRSSKKKLSLSQNIDESNEEVCDFKNVGDLSNITFDPDNSFIEILSEDEIEEEATQDELPNELEEKRYIRLDEERSEDSDSDIEDLGNISNLNEEIIMSQIQLEQEILLESKTRFLHLRNAYLQNLSEIRNSACLKLQHLRLEEHGHQTHEREKLEAVQKADSEQVLLAEENYMKDVTRKKDEILKEVEAFNLEEEKKANHIQSLIDFLKRDIETLTGNLILVQSEAQSLGCEGELVKILFQELPSICETTRNTVLAMNKFSTTEVDIEVISQRFAGALKILEDIQRLLDGKKEQRSSLKMEAPPYKEEADLASEEAISVLQPEGQTQTIYSSSFEETRKPDLAPVKITTPGTFSQQTFQGLGSSLKEAEEIFLSLKSKFIQISEEANAVRENAQLRPLLSRAVGIVNTLSTEKHDSSNKSKLQQIFNIINGRPCTFGSDSVSTAGNSSAQAFAKEQLASRIIVLAHDKQVATMSAYASLIVRLWHWYPDVGNLILYKLFETCPYLVPLVIRREAYQTDVEFSRALGIRIKEGGSQEAFDKYLTRMESCARLYGRIISLEVENHPHSIQEGWKWIARILICPVQPTITSALLVGFLSTAGTSLLGRYGKQFRKILIYIYATYLPNVEKDILGGGRAAFVGLRELLEQYQRTNSLPQVPEGYKLIL